MARKKKVIDEMKVLFNAAYVDSDDYLILDFADGSRIKIRWPPGHEITIYDILISDNDRCDTTVKEIRSSQSSRDAT